MPDQGLLLASVAYGPEYARLFLGPQLVSLLDPSNLPAVSDRASFVLFTDEATKPTIEAHPRFQALRSLIPTTVYVIPKGRGYDHRYDVQALTLGLSMAKAYKEGQALMYLTADGCYGQGCVPALVAKLSEGYDSVCGQAIRSSAEAIEAPLTSRGHSASELFELGFRTLNPLWIASHWESPCFSGIPYALLWSDTEQLVMRMASVSVHIIQPTKTLLQAKGCPDMVLHSGSTNPYMAYDWAEFPVVNVEPLRCFYPPFVVGHRASVEDYVAWSKGAIAPETLPNLTNVWRYQHPLKRPSEASTEKLVEASDAVVRRILDATGHGAVAIERTLALV